jgi:hypothetical protein
MGPPPPIFPADAKFAVIDGDPAANGLVTVRLMMPAGYKIAPHWHPTDEHITVLSGTFSRARRSSARFGAYSAPDRRRAPSARAAAAADCR